MLGIAVAGTNKFVLGFQLVGIRNTYEIESNHYKKLRDIMSDPQVGIVIVEEETMRRLEDHDRLEIESSVKPVVMVLSEEASSEGLRKMIKKSIGIDLWEK